MINIRSVATAFSVCYIFAGLLVAPGSAARASTISYAGSLIDLGPGWRTSSVSKGTFANTGGVLGEDGYYVPGAQGVVSMPSYVSSFSPNGSTYPGNSTYAYIDNPATTPGLHPTDLLSGTFNPNVGTNKQATLLSFALKASVPSDFQVGLMVDNLDIALYNDYAITLSSPNSGAAPTVSLTAANYNNRIPDWVFFDVTGALAGETISIVATAGAGTTATLGAVSFDSVTSAPEPASLAILGGGLALLGLVRRRGRADAQGQNALQ